MGVRSAFLFLGTLIQVLLVAFAHQLVYCDSCEKPAQVIKRLMAPLFGISIALAVQCSFMCLVRICPAELRGEIFETDGLKIVDPSCSRSTLSLGLCVSFLLARWIGVVSSRGSSPTDPVRKSRSSIHHLKIC